MEGSPELADKGVDQFVIELVVGEVFCLGQLCQRKKRDLAEYRDPDHPDQHVDAKVCDDTPTNLLRGRCGRGEQGRATK